jgi:hypothetical protein
MSRSRGHAPTVGQVAAYWREHEDELPWLLSHAIGWGEPFCFACEWLAPVPDYPAVAEEHPNWDPDHVERKTWDQAKSAGLEVAHLVDYTVRESNAIHNLVPLCSLCNRKYMPRGFKTRSSALDWVKNQERQEERILRVLSIVQNDYPRQHERMVEASERLGAEYRAGTIDSDEMQRRFLWWGARAMVLAEEPNFLVQSAESQRNRRRRRRTIKANP